MAKKYISTIVYSATAQLIKDKQLTIVATSVMGRLRVKTGSTYNCFNLEAKFSDGTIRNIAKGFEAYGYGRSYEDRAREVLRYLGVKDDIDFSHSDYVKAQDMFKVKHYDDSLRDGFVLDITDQVRGY